MTHIFWHWPGPGPNSTVPSCQTNNHFHNPLSHELFPQQFTIICAFSMCHAPLPQGLDLVGQAHMKSSLCQCH